MTDKSSRRQFLQSTAAAAVAGSTIHLEAQPLEASRDRGAPSDRVRFGMIGVGMQGSGLLTTSVSIPGVECAAACDLYDGRHALAREIAGDKLRTTRRYQELLDDQSIDCIVAAVPDHWHKKIVVDAVSAGKDIYCEKPMSHSVADGYEMVSAAQKAGRTGPDRLPAYELGPLCQGSRDHRRGYSRRHLHDRRLARAQRSHRRLAIPSPARPLPANLDWDTWQGEVPKRPFDANIFARWRCWKEYGTGVAGDLMVHAITGMLYAWGRNEAPVRAVALGGILRFKDGRNMPDVHAVLFDYGNVPVYIRLMLACETPEVVRFLGYEGHPRAGRERHHPGPPDRRGHRPLLLRLRPSQGAPREVLQGVAPGPRSQAGARAPARRDQLQGAVVRRDAPAPRALLPGGEDAAGHLPGRRLRQPRGPGLPHGQRGVLPGKPGPPERGHQEPRQLSGSTGLPASGGQGSGFPSAPTGPAEAGRSSPIRAPLARKSAWPRVTLRWISRPSART